jgi:DNA-binding transcriptional LysR family regulator
MDLDLLRTFVIAEEAETLGIAAQKLHVTKSAISQKLKALEARLGVRLFERVGRNVRPTEAARALASSLRGAFALVDDAVETVRDVHGAIGGEVRVGAPRPFTASVLRPRIAKLLAAHPDVVLDLSFGTPTELEARLLAGDLDLAVLARAPESDRVTTKELFVETFVAVASPRYLDRRGTPRALEDWDGHRIVVFDRDLPMHAAFWRAAYGRAALRGTIACRVASLDELRALAEAGAGIAVLPDYFVEDAVARGKLTALRTTAAKSARNAIVLAARSNAVAPARVRVVQEALGGG